MNEAAPLQPREFFTSPPVARELPRPSDGYRLFVEPQWSSGAVSRLYYSDKRLAPWVFRNAFMPREPAAWGFRTVLEHDVDLTNLLWTADFVEAMWTVRKAGRPDWAETFEAMSNVGYRAAFRPFREEVARHPDVRELEPTIFVPAPGNARYFFADEIVRAATKDEFTRVLIHETHSRRAAYVPFAPFATGGGDVLSVDERANEVTLKVHANSRALLVASVTAQKWWHAAVDGTPAPIERVNIAYQGIVIPPGNHTVVMRYQNRMISIGAAVSVIASIALLIVAIGRRRVTAA